MSFDEQGMRFRRDDLLHGEELPVTLRSRRLARLVQLPALVSPRERLDAALGPELARFLVTALSSDGQGRVGSSSP